jgi:hypothetical protein
MAKPPLVLYYDDAGWRQKKMLLGVGHWFLSRFSIARSERATRLPQELKQCFQVM